MAPMPSTHVRHLGNISEVAPRVIPPVHVGDLGNSLSTLADSHSCIRLSDFWWIRMHYNVS